MRRALLRCLIGLAFAVLVQAGPVAQAQAQALTREAAAQLYAGAGFPISPDGQSPLNRCGSKASPRITFVDMNGDGRKEALFIDGGPCYKPDGRWYAIATQGTDGRWRRVLEGPGVIAASGTSYNGWFVLNATSAGRKESLRFDGAAYRPATAQVGGSAQMPSTAGGKPTPPAVAASSSATGPGGAKAASAGGASGLTRGAATGDAAIFAAAGFRNVRGRWESGCNDDNEVRDATYEPGQIIERKDLNGDGRADAVISEGGLFCYGNTGSAFWVMGQQADGSWKKLTEERGIPEFKNTRGVAGWPDIIVGGPGFCFPVIRWNGTAYKPFGFEYEGKRCSPPR